MTKADLLDWQQVLAYREFFDIPRAFILEPITGLFLLFDCPFDDTSDDYSGTFNVYPLQIATVEALPQDWRTLTARSQDSVGAVAVAEIEFDETRRKQVRLQKLAALVAATEQAAVS
jgi:hypothetical protein